MSLVSERPLVLLVEDDRDGRMLFAEWLRRRRLSRRAGAQRPAGARARLRSAARRDPHRPEYPRHRRIRIDPAPQERSPHVVDARSSPSPATRRSRRIRRAPTAPAATRCSRKPCDPDELTRTLRTLHHGGPRPAHGLIRLMAASVMIVEDDPDTREMLERFLQLEGFDVRTAANGQLALDALQADSEPCVILLDLMMPVMNGWQFRQAQASDPELSRHPGRGRDGGRRAKRHSRDRRRRLAVEAGRSRSAARDHRAALQSVLARSSAASPALRACADCRASMP